MNPGVPWSAGRYCLSARLNLYLSNNPAAAWTRSRHAGGAPAFRKQLDYGFGQNDFRLRIQSPEQSDRIYTHQK